MDKKIQELLDLSSDGIHILNKDGYVIQHNKAFAQMLGYLSEEINLLNVKDFDVEFEKDNLINFVNNSIKNLINDEYTFYTKHIKKDRTIIDVSVNVKSVEINGEFFLYASSRDITKEKIYEEELEKQKHELELEKTKYKILMEYSSDAIFIVDLDGFVIENNKLFRNILGYDNEVLKLHVSDFEAIHTKEQIKDNIKNISFEPKYFESKYKKRDGTLFDVSISIIRVIINKQEYIYASIRDITEQKRLQNNILKQKEEFETIFEYSHDGIAIVDLNRKFLKFNTSFLNMLEYTKEELLTKSCSDLTAIEDLERNELSFSEIMNKGHIDNFEKNCITKTGKKINVNMSASYLPDKKTILLSMKDISSLKIMEEQSKLASMGEMIGNIAHQWRQPLSVITTSISGLKLKSDLSSIDKSDIEECERSILKQAKYLSETIDNFRNFIKGDNDYAEISLKGVLENAINLVHSSFQNNFINVITDFKDDLKIFGNKNELVEAFINILNNSKDALKSNIKLESDRLIFITTKLLDENTIEIKILDSGKGIKNDILKKIFEPYFTTKHQSQGTGLGLSMANKIIRERHNGKIIVSNEEFEYNGKKHLGASFKIIFSQKDN